MMSSASRSSQRGGAAARVPMWVGDWANLISRRGMQQRASALLTLVRHETSAILIGEQAWHGERGRTQRATFTGEPTTCALLARVEWNSRPCLWPVCGCVTTSMNCGLPICGTNVMNQNKGPPCIIHGNNPCEEKSMADH